MPKRRITWHNHRQVHIFSDTGRLIVHGESIGSIVKRCGEFYFMPHVRGRRGSRKGHAMPHMCVPWWAWKEFCKDPHDSHFVPVAFDHNVPY